MDRNGLDLPRLIKMELLNWCKSIATSKCIWSTLNVFLHFGSLYRSMASLHTMNNCQWTFMNNMAILTYHWIGPCMSRYSLSPQPSMNSIDFMVTGFPIKTNCMPNHGNVFMYFLSIVCLHWRHGIPLTPLASAILGDKLSPTALVTVQ